MRIDPDFIALARDLRGPNRKVPKLIGTSTASGSRQGSQFNLPDGAIGQFLGYEDDGSGNAILQAVDLPTGGSVVVEEGDAAVVSATSVLDFDASDFNVSESPAGEANISLAYGTAAGTPAEGNHTHGASGVPVLVFPFISGRWYDQDTVSALADPSTITYSAGVLYAVPILIPEDYTLDRIAVRVTTAAAGGSLARLGIYNVGSGGMPGALLLDAGAVATDSAVIQAAIISQPIVAGPYYLALLPSANVVLKGYSVATQTALGMQDVDAQATRFGYVTVSQAYGALPNPFTAGATVAGEGGPRIGVRRA